LGLERRHFILGRDRAAIDGPIENPELIRPKEDPGTAETPSVRQRTSSTVDGVSMSLDCPTVV
jgi:hypothetical protein